MQVEHVLLFGKGEAFSHHPAETLAYGVVEPFNRCRFPGFLSHLGVRQFGQAVVRAPKVAEAVDPYGSFRQSRLRDSIEPSPMKNDNICRVSLHSAIQMRTWSTFIWTKVKTSSTSTTSAVRAVSMVSLKGPNERAFF